MTTISVRSPFVAVQPARRHRRAKRRAGVTSAHLQPPSQADLYALIWSLPR